MFIFSKLFGGEGGDGLNGHIVNRAQALLGSLIYA